MINELLKSNFAIIGGGRFCKNLLGLLKSDDFKDQGFSVVGVADINLRAEGLLYAEKMGIFTTRDYTDLYRLV